MAKTLILDPIWTLKIFSMGFFSTSSLAMFQAMLLGTLQENEWPKLEKVTKNLILGLILVHVVQIWVPLFYGGGVPLLVVRHCSKLSSYTV